MRNFKTLFTILLFTIVSFICLPSINAETPAYVDATALRLRSKATTDSDTLIKIGDGESLTIIDTNKINGDGCDGGWYKAKYNNIEGYVCSNYIKFGNINTGYNTSNFTARVHATTLSARSYASSNASKQATLINGTNVTVLETLSSGSGCNDRWYKVNYHDGQIGYVCSTYIVKKEDITASDSEYEKVLSDAGFPSTYWPYLTYLHNKYPNWKFKAVNTGLNWSDVISGESGKNLIENTIYDAYRTSSNPSEGSSWFEATDGVNAFFLDPRNFLTEKYIFMFENLQYDETTQGTEIVKSIFGSGYLSADEYVNYFIDAGKKFNVSPVHLASRVVQEGGARSGYAAVSGEYNGTYRGYSLTGYYNYYNIGAYADDYTSDPVVRGLAYARGLVGGSGTSYGRPWTSREKAIHGGAEFISDGYISEGQYTLYFEKFNTSPSSGYSKYTHQYMTNVQAPSSEASNVSASYRDNNIIGNAYLFAIPIYKNMPESVSLPTIGDVVNSLSAISINDKVLPEFDSDVTSYTYYISNDTKSITVKATSTSSLSKVEGTGNIEIDTDNTTVTIKVTSQTGDIKVYTILISKVSEVQTIEDIFSNLDVKINSTYLTGIKENTTINDLSTNIKKYGPSASLSFKNSSGSELTVSSPLATGYVFTIKTTTNETKTYNIVVKGDSSGDGKITILDLLQVQKDILNSKKLTGAYSLAGDTSGDGKITILDLLQMQKHLIGDKKL